MHVQSLTPPIFSRSKVERESEEGVALTLRGIQGGQSNMMLCLIEQELRHELVLYGGITRTIFPQTEKILSSSDFQQALQFVASRKKMTRYRSMMDFLFCELHPKYRYHCRRFYDDKGPILREMIARKQIKEFDKRLVKALKIAHGLYRKQRCKSWGWYREQVEEALKAAA